MSANLPRTGPALVLYTDDGAEVALPARFEVCPRCDGRGEHDHPAFANGISADEMNQTWDAEEIRTYLSGGYDVQCTVCQGLRVVSVVDRSKCAPKLLAEWDAQERERKFDDQIWAGEIARGA